MRAKGRAMRVMPATMNMLRIFICYYDIHVRTRTRATQEYEYNRNIQFFQRLHKTVTKRILFLVELRPPEGLPSGAP